MIGLRQGTTCPRTNTWCRPREDTSSMAKQKKMRDHASDLADMLAPHVETAKEKAGPLLVEAREKAGPALAEARQKAAPVIAEAREKAAPVIAEAREKAAPALNDARDRITTEVLPLLTAAIAAVDEATEDARTEAKK